MEQWQVGPVPEYIYGNSTNHPNDMHAQQPYQQHMSARRNEQMEFRPYTPPPPQAQNQQHHANPVQPPMNVAQQHAQQQHVQQQHAAQRYAQQQQQQQQQHAQPPHGAPQQPPPTAPAGPTATPTAQRSRKRPNPATAGPAATTASPIMPPPIPTAASSATAAPPGGTPSTPIPPASAAPATASSVAATPASAIKPPAVDSASLNPAPPPAKKSRTNTPWTPAEEHRLKQMRDAGSSWAEIAKTFPTRTEGSVKKHWYKDMHYAEFAEDESVALLNAIKEYENQKWKVIGQKVGKPAKACEQYAKEHFADQVFATSGKR